MLASKMMSEENWLASMHVRQKGGIHAGHEEDRHGDLELVPHQTEVLFHPVQAGIANVDAGDERSTLLDMTQTRKIPNAPVEEAHEIQEHDQRDDMEVNLADESLFAGPQLSGIVVVLGVARRGGAVVVVDWHMALGRVLPRQLLRRAHDGGGGVFCRRVFSSRSSRKAATNRSRRNKKKKKGNRKRSRLKQLGRQGDTT